MGSTTIDIAAIKRAIKDIAIEQKVGEIYCPFENAEAEYKKHKKQMSMAFSQHFLKMSDLIVGDREYLLESLSCNVGDEDSPQIFDGIDDEFDGKNPLTKVYNILPKCKLVGGTSGSEPQTCESELLNALAALKIPGVNVIALALNAGFQNVVCPLIKYFAGSFLGKKQSGPGFKKLKNRRDLERVELILDFLLLSVLLMESWPDLEAHKRESKKGPLISEMLLAIFPCRPGSPRSKDFMVYLEKFASDPISWNYIATFAGIFYCQGPIFLPRETLFHAIKNGGIFRANDESQPFLKTCNYLGKYYKHKSQPKSASTITIAPVHTAPVAVTTTAPIGVPST